MPFYVWCYVHCFAVPTWWNYWLHPGGGCGYGKCFKILPGEVYYHGDTVVFVRRQMILEFCSFWKDLVILSFLLNVDSILQVCPHWCSTVGKNPLPWPGSTPSNAGWDPVRHLSCKGTLLASVHLGRTGVLNYFLLTISENAASKRGTNSGKIPARVALLFKIKLVESGECIRIIEKEDSVLCDLSTREQWN